MNNDLKPCPFCKGEVIVFSSGNHWPEEYFKILCKKNCCVQGKFFKTPEEAAEAWNRRASDE